MPAVRAMIHGRLVTWSWSPYHGQVGPVFMPIVYLLALDLHLTGSHLNVSNIRRLNVKIIAELSTKGKVFRVLWSYMFRQVALILLLYLFICSLDFLSSAFRLLGGDLMFPVPMLPNAKVVCSASRTVGNRCSRLAFSLTLTVFMKT